MLINFKEFLSKGNYPKIGGCIHVGAHEAQENQAYTELGIKKVVYVEPCKDAFAKLTAMFGKNKDITLINCALADFTGTRKMFTTKDGQGQSNSLMRPKTHLQAHPEIKFTGEEMVIVRRLDDLNIANREIYNFLNVDVQGAEALVLKGGTETLKHIDICYLEVNREQLYEGCAMVEELDKILSNFDRVKTEWTNFGWGDSIYIRRVAEKYAAVFPTYSEDVKSDSELEPWFKDMEPLADIPEASNVQMATSELEQKKLIAYRSELDRHRIKYNESDTVRDLSIKLRTQMNEASWHNFNNNIR